MMDVEEVFLAEHLLKVIAERQQRITTQLVGGAVKDMEQYRHLVGSMETLQYLYDEIREIIEKAPK